MPDAGKALSFVSMEIDRADVVVVGLGAMGAATLYQLARRGVRALGVDRFAPPHALGSSHGETRITRRAGGEGDDYVPLVTRSHAIWRQLEAETGERLFEPCGLLMMAPRGVRTGHHKKIDYLNRTIGVARRTGVVHEVLDATAIGSRFPALLLAGDEEGYFEAGGGFVHPERCVAVQLQQAVALGARVLTGRAVLEVAPEGGGVVVRTDAGPIRADRVVVAAGAWTGKLLGAGFLATMVPYRQVQHWFGVEDAEPFQPGVCPVYIWMHGHNPDDYFYGFPALAGEREVKVASEQSVPPCDPDAVDRLVGAGESEAMYRLHVGGRLAGVQAPARRAAVCLYTTTPDSNFVIDRHPSSERIIVVSACSGHGFKHSGGIGEAVAEMVCDGRSEADLGPFRFGRLQQAA